MSIIQLSEGDRLSLSWAVLRLANGKADASKDMEAIKLLARLLAEQSVGLCKSTWGCISELAMNSTTGGVHGKVLLNALEPPPPAPSKFEPTEEQRRVVRLMVSSGIPEDEICRVIGASGIDAKTFLETFHDEIADGTGEANRKITNRILQIACQSEDLKAAATAAIWWTKTRMGWKDSSDPMSDIGWRIVTAREELGITQDELATRLGVDISTVALWERCLTKPRMELLSKIADALQIKLDFLMTGEAKE